MQLCRNKAINKPRLKIVIVGILCWVYRAARLNVTWTRVSFWSVSSVQTCLWAATRTAITGGVAQLSFQCTAPRWWDPGVLLFKWGLMEHLKKTKLMIHFCLQTQINVQNKQILQNQGKMNRSLICTCTVNSGGSFCTQTCFSTLAFFSASQRKKCGCDLFHKQSPPGDNSRHHGELGRQRGQRAPPPSWGRSLAAPLMNVAGNVPQALTQFSCSSLKIWTQRGGSLRVAGAAAQRLCLFRVKGKNKSKGGLLGEIRYSPDAESQRVSDSRNI